MGFHELDTESIERRHKGELGFLGTAGPADQSLEVPRSSPTLDVRNEYAPNDAGGSALGLAGWLLAGASN